MRVLVVDDSDVMRTLERHVLSQLGFTEIDEAVDGVDALAKVEASPPGLILLDWNMPRMDGLAFVEKYRAMAGKAHIMMVTVEAGRPMVLKAIAAGADRYVIKPFTAQSLGEQIRDLVS